jgi:hypothetical protein
LKTSGTNSEPYVAVSTLPCFLVIYRTIRQGLN